MIRVTANPNIGCKFPATINGTLVRSMCTIILCAARAGGNRSWEYRKPRNPDPNEGNAR